MKSKLFRQIPLIIGVLAVFVAGCAIGHKEWPTPAKGEDVFSLKLVNGQRGDDCLYVELRVSGAVDQLAYVNLQLEPVGDGPGMGCAECPFMPRSAVRISREDAGFELDGSVLKVSHCGLELGIEYRFRIVGVNKLTSLAYVYTDIYTATP